MLTADAVKQRAHELGFDLCGIAPAAGFPELQYLPQWLARGYGGRMGYLPRTAERRQDVRRVLPTARAVIVTGTLYNTDQPYSVERNEPAEGLVSRYAWGDDYHEVLARRLEALLEWMREAHGGPFDARPYVDTGPVQERVYAQYAGLGWIGKNTCVINPHLGSWLFLAEIICSLALEPDAPAVDQCGSCTLCLEACPTGALVEPRVLDATRCVSYLTIELKGPIPEALREPMGRHIYGCDICQDVCPYNLNAPVSPAGEWQPRRGLESPRLAELWRRSDAALEELVGGGPMTRPRLEGLRRNVAVAAGNSADQAALNALGEDEVSGGGLASPSRSDPIVRDHIEWARRRAGRQQS